MILLFLFAATSFAIGPVTSVFPVDYGGGSRNLMPEAIEANIVSLAIDNGWNYRISPRNIPGDVVANIPVWITGSTYSPFGDGQTNARIQMPVTGWVPEHALDAPLVAWMILNRNTSNVMYFNVLMSCQFGASAFVTVVDGGQMISVPSVLSTRIANFNACFNAFQLVMPFPLSQQFSGTQILWGNFTNRYDFTIDLNMPVTDHTSFMGSVPQQQRTFTNGQSLYDPENLDTTCGTLSPFDCLMKRSPLNSQAWQNLGRPYFADNLHGRFPTPSGQYVTVSVANLSTWVAVPPQSPLKTVYSCWSPRNLQQEKQYGVPSGAGWHLIGDPAETIFNNVRSGEMLVGMAAPPTKNSLQTTAVWRVLRPYEVWVTTKGYYHTYLISSDTDAPCVQILAHSCSPPPKSASYC